MNKLFNKLFAVFMAFILAIAGLALKPAIPARAAGTIYFVGGCILPSCLGGSWNTGFLTLQEALATASSGDQIWVKMGTYYPDEGPGQTNNSASSTFTLKNGVEIYGGFAGTETLLNQRNVSANLTILSGDIDKNDLVSANGYVLAGNNANHVVTASGTNSTAVLDGFLIQQGDADGAGGLNSVGGGIVNDAGNATFSNLTIFSNEAVTGGGGMYNRNSDPTLTSVSFSKNKTDNDGGGMMNFQGSSPALTNVTFDANTAGDRGGGMYNESSSSPTMSGGSMTNNVSGPTSVSGDGGAMYNANGSSPTVSNVAFTSNTADNGGGMYNNNASNPSVSNLTFASNVARDSGGGMYNFDHANPVLTNVFFTANISNDSGGAGMYNQVLSAPTLTNVTFQSNQAVNGYGGGMMNNESTVTLNQVTFNNNSATFDGGGMYSFSG
ncbi:MAG TPA: hypothetical protein PK989_11040, partial [Anaerolineales bacterium]|nr:hypothetical protein [Anaerolineales bacterium]